LKEQLEMIEFFKKNGIIQTGFYSRKSHNVFSAKESLLKSEIAKIIIDKFLQKVNSFAGTKKEFKDLIVPQSEVISHEVRAKSLIITDTEECSRDSKYYTKEWDIEGVKVIISIKN